MSSGPNNVTIELVHGGTVHVVLLRRLVAATAQREDRDDVLRIDARHRKPTGSSRVIAMHALDLDEHRVAHERGVSIRLVDQTVDALHRRSQRTR